MSPPGAASSRAPPRSFAPAPGTPRPLPPSTAPTSAWHPQAWKTASIPRSQRSSTPESPSSGHAPAPPHQASSTPPQRTGSATHAPFPASLRRPWQSTHWENHRQPSTTPAPAAPPDGRQPGTSTKPPKQDAQPRTTTTQQLVST